MYIFMTKKTSLLANMIASLAKTFGLSESTAKVYVALLSLKQANVSQIARASSLRRTTVYPHIEDLQNRQFLTEVTKGRRTLYTATPPQTLLEMAESQVGSFGRTLPQLLAISQASPEKPRVRYYEGVDGIKSVFADTLQAGQEIVGWSDYEYSMKRLPNFFEQYAQERARRNILYRVIARNTPAGRDRAIKANRHLREVKFSNTPGIETDLYIYGDRVAHVNFQTDNMFAVIIEDLKIAATLRAIWRQAWQQAG